MPNIKSQVKRIKVSRRQAERNKPVRSGMKTHITNFRAAVAKKKKKEANVNLGKAIKALDSAASKGIIHRNNAANKKSALTKAYNAMK